MSPALRSALLRLARALLFAMVAAGIAVLLGALPALGPLVPGGELAVPALTAFLLALDKYVRARKGSD